MISLKAVSKWWKLPLFFTTNLSYEHPPTSASDTPITGLKRAFIVDITGLTLTGHVQTDVSETVYGQPKLLWKVCCTST